MRQPKWDQNIRLIVMAIAQLPIILIAILAGTGVMSQVGQYHWTVPAAYFGTWLGLNLVLALYLKPWQP